MSTEENKALIRRVWEEVWNKGDFAAQQELIPTDLVDHNPLPSQPLGLEGHHQILVMFRNAFPDLHITLEEVIAEEDNVSI
jgi:predicted ester cyclase